MWVCECEHHTFLLPQALPVCTQAHTHTHTLRSDHPAPELGSGGNDALSFHTLPAHFSASEAALMKEWASCEGGINTPEFPGLF